MIGHFGHCSRTRGVPLSAAATMPNDGGLKLLNAPERTSVAFIGVPSGAGILTVRVTLGLPGLPEDAGSLACWQPSSIRRRR